MPTEQTIPSEPGTYMLVLRLAKTRRITVGKLGEFEFPAGWYLYAGSAQGGLSGRVLRHLRANKKQHWHIDYLNAPKEAATVMEVWWQVGGGRLECEWADAARGLQGAEVPAPGFGASDCGCESHLVRVDEKPDAAVLKRTSRAFSVTSVSGD